MKDCKWSDTILEVAWRVWHKPELFIKMKESVPCDLEPVSGESSPESRKKWFSWLAAMNEAETGFNMHEVWLWYYHKYISPHLQG
jgi:hypothetical protein